VREAALNGKFITNSMQSDLLSVRETEQCLQFLCMHGAFKVAFNFQFRGGALDG